VRIFDGCLPAIPENEQTARKSIGRKRFLANPSEAVYPFAKIDRRHCHQNAHLGSNLDHSSPSQSRWLSVINSAVAAPLT
jgi:hypothetical protein